MNVVTGGVENKVSQPFDYQPDTLPTELCKRSHPYWWAIGHTYIF